MKRIFVVIVASLLLVSILSGMALAAKTQSLTPKFKEIKPYTKNIYNGLTPAEKKQMLFDNIITLNVPIIVTPWEPVYIDIPM